MVGINQISHKSILKLQQFQIQKVANNTDTSIKIGIKILRKPKLQFHPDNAREGSNFQYYSRFST